MKIKQQKIIALIVFPLLMMAFMPGGEKAKKPIYLNPAFSIKERIADLVSRITPEEKQSQQRNTKPPSPRPGVIIMMSGPILMQRNQTHLFMFRSTTSA